MISRSICGRQIILPSFLKNYGTLQSGYAIPGAADTLLLGQFGAMTTVAQIHNSFREHFRASDEVLARHDGICAGGRCADAVFDAADLTLIVLGLRSGNPNYFLRVADASFVHRRCPTALGGVPRSGGTAGCGLVVGRCGVRKSRSMRHRTAIVLVSESTQRQFAEAHSVQGAGIATKL